MHAEIYTDGVDEITIGGSIVRVDLFSLSPTERDANNAPQKVLCQRLIFSVESFANSVEVMQKALQGLINAGAVRRSQTDEPTESTRNIVPVERSSSIKNSQQSPNVSTNFS